MKIRLFLKAVVVVAAVSLHGATYAQVRGETRNIPVRMISEPWAATQTAGFPSPNAGLLVPAPQNWTDFLNSRSNQPTSSARQTESTAANSLLGVVFPGPADGIPPDSQIAAGPNHLVSVVNSVVAIISKSGNTLSTTGLNSFFQSLVGNGCGCFDSRILYDQNNGRFILSTSMRSNTSAILLAVSQTSDPTGSWNKFEINPSTTNWYDFPTLGLSSSAVYISADPIANSGGTATGFDITVVGLAELLAGNSNLNITHFPANASSGAIQGAITYGDSPTEYLLRSAEAGVVLHLYMINTAGTPTLTTTDVAVPAYKDPPPFAPQPGQGQLINSPSEILSAVSRDNSLWTAQSIASDDGSTAVIRWYEIDTNTKTVKQTGTVAGAGNANYGVITVLPDGEATLIYSTSSATQFASAGFAHRSPSDPAGTMPVSGIYQAGTTTYNVSRWGDYSGASPDPDGQSVWGIAELALTSNTTSTSIAQILSTAPAPSPDFGVAPTPGSATVTQGQSAAYTITVSPQNGFQNAVTLSCSGLPTNAGCSFLPSSVTPGANAVTSQLTITTAAPKSAMSLPNSILTGAVVGTLWIPLAGVLRLKKRQKYGWTLAAMLAFILSLTWLIGCGGVGSQSSNSMPSTPPVGGTPTGTYAITVLGTSGSLQHSTTVNLEVK
ncbi:MAG TPA: hypothetical protein VJA94_16755 [Candidatus Angelobacter sp.]